MGRPRGLAARGVRPGVALEPVPARRRARREPGLLRTSSPPQARVPGGRSVYTSLGITQVKWIPDGSVGAGTEPLRWKSLAFNLDYQAATLRLYYDDPGGARTAWGDRSYAPCQAWKSVGGWFAPYPWDNPAQRSYIAQVQATSRPPLLGGAELRPLDARVLPARGDVRLPLTEARRPGRTGGPPPARRGFSSGLVRCLRRRDGPTRCPRSRRALILVSVVLAGVPGGARVLRVRTNGAAPERPCTRALPRITGVAQEGHRLRAVRGRWTGASHFAYRWLRCDAHGRHCYVLRSAAGRAVDLRAGAPRRRPADAREGGRPQPEGKLLRGVAERHERDPRRFRRLRVPSSAPRRVAAILCRPIGRRGPARLRATRSSTPGRRCTFTGSTAPGPSTRASRACGIFDGPSDEASVAAIRSWNANIVRIPINEDCWLGINGVPAAYSGQHLHRRDRPLRRRSCTSTGCTPSSR